MINLGAVRLWWTVTGYIWSSSPLESLTSFGLSLLFLFFQMDNFWQTDSKEQSSVKYRVTAGAAAFGITRSIYSLQEAQMHRHVVPLCRPVNLVHLMNIDHVHPDTLLRVTNKNSGASEWHPGNSSFDICTFTKFFSAQIK